MRFALAAFILASCTRPPAGMGETGDSFEDCHYGTRNTYEECVSQSDDGGVCKVAIWTQRCGGEYMDACEETECTAAARVILDSCQPDWDEDCAKMAPCLDSWLEALDACFAE